MLCNAPMSYMLWEDALDALPSRDKTAIGWDMFGSDEEAMKKRFIRQAQAAWTLIHHYQLSWEWKDYREFELPRFFHKWGRAYERLCSEKRLMDEPRALGEFNRRVYDRSLTPSPSLWVGWMEEMPPIYKRIHELCSSGMRNAAPSLYEQPIASERSRLRYSDEEQELRAAAAAVREAYNRDPAQVIGVIIPGLEQMWHRVRGIFRDAFHADPLEYRAPSFNMSWGEKLQSHPLIGDLLRLLGLTLEPRPLGDFVDLFQSPYIRGAEVEQAGRFQLKEELLSLSLGNRRLSLPQLLQTRSIKRHLASCPQLRDCLGGFLSVKGGFRAQASPHHWTRVFTRQAEALGWGAVSHWSPQEIYLRDRWAAMLDSLYGLYRIMPLCSRTRAMSFLQAAAQALFQPYRSRPRIHILGLREAEGLRFDRLFVCRMNEHAVPSPAANFLIPYRLGQAGRVPGYGAELNWAAEKRLIHYLSRAATRVRFTYAARVNDEEQLVHPLLRSVPELAGEEAQEAPRAVPPREEREDHDAPSVATNETVRSLVTLVRHQAACPFRAFARFRLNLEEGPVLAEQLTSQDRGSMVHELLRDIWSELGDKQRLLDTGEDELRAFIERRAQRIIADWSRKRVFLREDMLAELERRYLTDLTGAALEYERREPRSFRIHALEEKREAPNFCGYDFSLYIDRVDALDEAGCMILDYKLTGRRLGPSSLTEDRPDEPQLLIYSMLVKDIKALGLMVLSPKTPPFITGLTLEDAPFASSRSWQRLSREQLVRAQEGVERLFRDFLRGAAAVDPKRVNTCRHCSYHSLCRIGG